MAKHSTRQVASSQEPEVLAENPAYAEKMAELMNNLVPEGWVDVQLSFPPYWKPDVLTGFRGTVLYRDERDGTFPRYVIKSSVPLTCRTGPTADGEVIDIVPGQNFSIGVYATLNLDRFFGFEISAICTGKGELPGNATSKGVPRDIWRFRTMVAPEISRKLESQRQADILYVQEAQRQAHREMLKELARAKVEATPANIHRAMTSIM